MELLLYLYIFAIGSMIGSFLNCVIYRLPLKQSIVSPGSFCTNCKTPIKWRHNIPIFSWIILRGKCANCSESFSFRYPLIELLYGVIFLFLFIQFGGFTSTFSFYVVLSAALTAITFIDFDHQIIPDAINYPLLVIGIPFIWLVEDRLVDGLLGGIAASAFFLLLVVLTKGRGMGMGDVKMIAMLGLWFGMLKVFFIVMISSILGSIVGLLMMAFGKARMKTALPYGTFIAIAGIVMIFLGDQILSQYWLFYG